MARDTFDEKYYRRFYSDKPVHTKRKVAQLATAVDALAAWWDIPVRSVLDVGAGPGYWRDWYRDNRPRVKVTSTDISEYACKKYGHELRDITTWTPTKKYDFVICHGVLHYLNDAGARNAINNLAAGCASLLYIEAPTTHDLEHIVDTSATDMSVHSRPGSWYQRHLSKHFIRVGAGLWAHKDAGIPLYELETAEF